MAEFRRLVAEARRLVVLTGALCHLPLAPHTWHLAGAGVSAESGVPTFRGAGGYWRTYQVPGALLATSLPSSGPC